ncbi:MAG: translesion error-prone DNA polymerase V subunit UmuC [SAR86 cluster bacterium]|uniref:Translesion error-prone DNA polymerase V subunit UmuC n=1 Tax=SAR86 cluster bacterium TaxID=2030880 RepID=A0A368BKV2_9GAMM|nr:MAG: translesion error-prone DNA polymerase V subunit UmuC [SAR86 cluster bacterium]|tara:strand:- start:4857 stop:6119 length:1263 start_codon:yes stop_codon:yes gene_type:complete
MYALVDCNSFYASCEKIFRPDLKNKPVIVLSNNDGCVIARSPEAKKMGLTMGQPWYQIREDYIGRGGVVFSSNYELYADISNRVMNLLAASCPEIDIYSIDEAFLNLQTYEKNIDLIRFAFESKEKIKKWIGIPVSIGIAPTKTLAKLANKMAKDDDRFDGVVILQDKKIIQHSLKMVEIEKIWGIGKRLAKRLQAIGIKNALQLSQTEPRLMRDNFSVVLERTIRELKGQPCLGANNILEPKKQIMVSRSFGKSIDSKKIINEAISFHAGRAAEKLRFEDQKCSLITVFIRSNPFNRNVKQIYSSNFIELIHPTDDSRVIIKSANQILDKIYRKGYKYSKAGVLLSSFSDRLGYQMNLFEKSCDSKKSERLMSVVDFLNLTEKGKLYFGNQGYRNTWKMKRDMKSKRYTTKIDEIPIAK